MLVLLKCDADELPPPPSEEELDHQAFSLPGSGPTVDNFTIQYMTEKIHHSSWNQDLWTIFIQKVDDTWGHVYSTKEDKTATSTWFWGHLKHLSHKYFMQVYGTPHVVAMARSLSARNTRHRKVGNSPTIYMVLT